MQEIANFAHAANSRLGIAWALSRFLTMACRMQFALLAYVGLRMQEPDHQLERRILSESRFPPTHSFTRVENVGPPSAAPASVGAAIAPRLEFRVRGANGDSEYLLGTTHLRVWKLPTRHMRREGRHVWQIGVRLGPRAGGESANYAHSGITHLFERPGISSIPSNYSYRRAVRISEHCAPDF